LESLAQRCLVDRIEGLGRKTEFRINDLGRKALEDSKKA
jgi:hypothetical protein